jgi:hypothetical protein
MGSAADAAVPALNEAATAKDADPDVVSVAKNAVQKIKAKKP